MKLRKFITLILIMCTIILTGCADVEFIRMIDSNNALQDKLVVELNKNELENSGYNVDDVLDKIESDFIEIKNYIDEWKKQFDKQELANVFDMVQDGIKVDVAPPVVNKITLTITFSDLSMFGLFYGYSSIEDNEYNKAMEDIGPFIDKMLKAEYCNEDYGWLLYKYSVIKDDGILSSLEDFEINGVNYHADYSEYFSEDFSREDMNISQIFTYPDDRIYSNADDKEVVNGVTFLRWSLSDKNDDYQMTIYKIAPNVINWYILAIVISFVVVIVASVVILTKYIKKKKGKLKVSNE